MHRSLLSKCPLRFQAPFLLHFELSDFTQHLERFGPFRFEALTLESTQLLSTVCNSEGFWRGADSGHLNALSRQSPPFRTLNSFMFKNQGPQHVHF